ncbi:hypothetical protein KKE92_03890 [Candidatus Micrarchaeota archaeon]|nr:hypothetical protein [Candidatus Micrarchaeota archaeon]MBU1681362.1 hypothetical protein [Candidatus Micrarchaeota archaeon]
MRQKFSQHTASRLRFSDPLLESAHGRTIVFVTEESNLRSEAKLMPHFFQRTGASSSSKVLGYSHFYDCPEGITADILILRSSKLFPLHLGKLHKALEAFRGPNPKAAAIISLLDTSLLSCFEHFASAGLVNFVETTLADDPALIKAGLEILERMQ